MKRTRYGLNSQVVTATQFQQYTPMGYIEVVPGDTIGGGFNVKIFSDTTHCPVFNRAYYDVIVTYSPYRLLWEGFPEFLLHGTSSVPTVADTLVNNFEKGFTSPHGATATTNAAWLRRMYNKSWNRYVRMGDQAEAGDDDANELQCYYRPSTFHEAVPEADSLTDVTIDTSGSTLGVDDIRDAFNTDRFNKVRSYYGERYVDYLASVGVKVNWSILEEPELLATSKNMLKFQLMNPSAADATTPLGPEGNPGGYYTADIDVKIRNKFFPE